ncbi:MAG TPA: S24 family peptidase [Phnomibacter sp.]|nr:S24 family peptidase [Phnomibacter sp.]
MTEVATQGKQVMTGKMDTGMEQPATSFVWYILTTSRLQPMGIYKGDKLLVEKTTALTAGQIVLLQMDGKLLLRKLEQSNQGWALVALQQKLASLEWPLHRALPILGVVRQVVREV